jgi:mRNA interferase RelE/StbE
VVKKRAIKNLEKLTPSNLDSVLNLLITLENEPIPYIDFDVAKLSGIGDDYRVRIGSNRIIYSVDWEQKVITISRIESRGRAYKK